MRVSKATFAQLIDAVPQPIAIVSDDLRVRFANVGWRKVFGEIPPRSRQPLLHTLAFDEDLPAFLALLDAEDFDDEAEAEIRLRQSSGSYGCYLVAVNRHRLVDDRVRWFVSCTDISQQKATEARLARRTQALIDEDKRKDEFLALLGHEVRNPLAAINGALITLEAGDETDAARAIDIMRLQLQQVSGLIDNLLDDARLRQGKVVLDKQPVDVASILAVSIESARAEASEKDVDIALALPSGDVAINADRVRLEQIVSNLVNNAVRYTPQGGSINIRAAVEEQSLEISVKDDGVGLSTDSIDEIFEPFTQLKTDEDGAGNAGLGVGLGLVRQLVELHDGEISAASDGEGEGSEFVVRLPGITNQTVEKIETTDSMTDELPQQIRILIVDDNEIAAEGLKLLLEMAGAEVEMCHAGHDALEWVDKKTFDAAVMDIGLPDIDGYELARRVRERFSSEAMTLIALTGYGHDAAKKDALAAGFDHHMVKPADYRKLIEWLRQSA